MKAPRPFLAAAGLALLAAPAWSQPASTAPAASQDHSAHHAAPASAPMAEGEVRRIDRAAGKITLRHGDIPSLGMPPMTMVFVVADPAFLERVQVGDRVRFQADRLDGAYRVTELQPAP